MLSGKMMRSAELWLMSRSCQRATFSMPTSALPRSTRAQPAMRSLRMGLRLCGMAEEPFWPLPNGSSASRTSVRCRWRTSVANFSMLAPTRAMAREELGVPVALHDLVADGLAADAELLADEVLDARVDVVVGADGAADLADRRR